MATLARPLGAPSLARREPARPDPITGQPITLAEIIDHEAMSFRSQGTDSANLIAETLERLSQLVRWTGASTAIDHADRMNVWEDEIRQQWYDRGYADGVEAGRQSARRHIS